MSRAVTVFVHSIKSNGRGVTVEAMNGGPEGPPFIRFELPQGEEARSCYIGKSYKITIEEQP